MSRTVAISCAVLAGVATGPFVPTWSGASAHTTQPAACAPAHISPPAPPGPVTATRDHFAGHAEPTLAVNPRTARNLLGAAQFALPGSFTRVPGTFYSTDGGRTWHDNGPLPLPLPPGYGYGDDVSAAFAGRTGLVAAEIYRADGSGGRVFAWRTTDGGRRFSPPVPVSAATARTDHPWLAVTTGPHGRPVVAVAWSQGESLLFSRSTDDGRTFSRPRRISAPGEAADLAVVIPGPRHALSVVYLGVTASSKTSMVRVTTSHDGGQTFTAPVTVSGALATQGAQPYEVSLVSAAADPRTGTLYVTYAEETGQPARLRVVLTRSRADGRWTAPAEVDPAAGGPGSDQFQPSAIATPQGQLYITYFVAAAGHVTEYLTQAGLHSRTRRLGSPFDPGCGLTVGVKETPWLGDYQALASSGGHAYAAWNDGGTGSLQILVEPVR